MAWSPPFDRPTSISQIPPAPPEPEEPSPPKPVVRHEDVIARVRELIGKYPNVGSRQLYDLAIRMHPELEDAGFRSFHARYVLPLKREKARAEGRLPKPRTRKEAPVVKARRGKPAAPAETAAAAAPSAVVDTMQTRARVRDVLLRLAREVAIAESRADLVDALARVERMVDEVMTALQPQEAPAEESEA